MRAVRASLGGPRTHRELALAELRGALVGLVRYPRSRRIARGVEARFGAGVGRPGEPTR